MKSRRDYALDLARLGLNIFPLPPHSKEPIAEVSWTAMMTSDLDTINGWFDAEPDMNYGVNGGSKFAIVDLDEKNGKEGVINFTALNMEQPGDDWCINTFTVRTPSGGQHLYLRVPYPVTNSASKIGMGIDVRGARGYVVGPGCLTAEVKDERGKIKQYAGNYTIELENELEEAPVWLLNHLLQHHERTVNSDTPLIELDLPVNIERAREFLETHTPAVEGNGGDEHTFKTCCWLKDFGVSAAMIFELLTEESGWNSRCLPNWTDADLRRKIENAYSYGQNQPGSSARLVHRAEFDSEPSQMPAQSSTSESEYPRPLTARELASGMFPRPEYLIDDLLLERHVNLLYGDGGVGKTTLALNLAVAISVGRPIFDRKVKQSPVLLVLNEDGNGETKHRLENICSHFKVSLKDLPLKIWCLPGYDGTLASISDEGAVAPGPFQSALDCELHGTSGAFVMLDSLIDVATLNESLRPPVNALLKRVLGGLCDKHKATLLIPGHPSKTSMADKTYYSGSTAFNAGVRSRLVLEQPDKNSARRLLQVAKSNYGPTATIELYLADSVFVPLSDARQIALDTEERDQVISTTTELLRKGVQIVRTHGNGQKPRDVADEIKKKFGKHIDAGRVAGILNAAERSGILVYRAANPKSRLRAGYALPTTANSQSVEYSPNP